MNFFRPKDPNIVALPKQLTKEFCDSVIARFKQDPNVYAGHTFGGYSPNVKQSDDLCISNEPMWEHEDRILSTALSNGLFKYFEKLSKNRINYKFGFELFDIGYQIQRTSPGGFYDWHPDACDSRYITFIFYLNDVKKGGYTEFIDGTRIQPKAGTLLFFPASWNYIHRGVAPVDEEKFIITGWMYNKLSDEMRVLSSSDRVKELLDIEQQYHVLKEQVETPNIGGHTPPEGDVALSYGQPDQNLILE